MPRVNKGLFILFTATELTNGSYIFILTYRTEHNTVQQSGRMPFIILFAQFFDKLISQKFRDIAVILAISLSNFPTLLPSQKKNNNNNNKSLQVWTLPPHFYSFEKFWNRAPCLLRLEAEKCKTHAIFGILAYQYNAKIPSV